MKTKEQWIPQEGMTVWFEYNGEIKKGVITYKFAEFPLPISYTIKTDSDGLLWSTMLVAKTKKDCTKIAVLSLKKEIEHELDSIARSQEEIKKLKQAIKELENE